MAVDAFFARSNALRSLQHRDFRLLLTGTMLVGLVMPAQFIVQTIWVQDTFPERDVLYVSLLAGARGVATLAFSLIGGAIADRLERRRVLFACESVSLLLNVLVAFLMFTTPFGEATILGIAALTFLAAGNQAIDIPTRTASIPTIVGPADMNNAIGLNQLANQLAIPLTIPIAGWLAVVLDPGAVYAATLVAWVGILPLIAALRFRSRAETVRSGMLRSIRDGLAYARRDQVIFPVLLLVLVLQGVGMTGPASLGVVWIRKVLEVGPLGFALMAMTWGGSAVLGAAFFAHRHHLSAQGRTLCLMTLLFGVGAIVFGHSRLIPLTAVANLVIGISIAGTMVCASVIVQHRVRDDMRGRVMGLFPLLGGLNMVNTAPVGAIGQAVGLEIVMPLIGWTTLILAVAVILRWPALRGMRPEPLPPIVEPVAAVETA